MTKREMIRILKRRIEAVHQAPASDHRDIEALKAISLAISALCDLKNQTEEYIDNTLYVPHRKPRSLRSKRV